LTAGIAAKSFKSQSSSRCGWFKFKRHWSQHRPPARSDGAPVAFTYSSSEENSFELVGEIESAGDEAVALRTNNDSVEELPTAVTKTGETLGPLDIFVSNAGILPRGTIDTAETSHLDFLRHRTLLVMRPSFVVCPGPRTESARGRFEGWVKVVDTGKRVKFQSSEELLRFLGQSFEEAPRRDRELDLRKEQSDDEGNVGDTSAAVRTHEKINLIGPLDTKCLRRNALQVCNKEIQS
jgi:NAD(P)-dependent dehydrogenase (short-subunit alcohol dehydrogenase family)